MVKYNIVRKVIWALFFLSLPERTAHPHQRHVAGEGSPPGCNYLSPVYVLESLFLGGGSFSIWVFLLEGVTLPQGDLLCTLKEEDVVGTTVEGWL